MPLVTVDVTGFYFEYIVDVPQESSVLDIMRKVEMESGMQVNPPSIFRFHSDSKGSIRNISIEHRVAPKSRQKDPNDVEFGPPGLVPGFYEYTDDSTGQNPTLAWQYYVLHPVADGVFETPSVDRTIRFAGKTANTFRWVNGSKLIWRLVGICTQPTNNARKGGVAY